MTRISNSEAVIAAVRAQLQRIAKRGEADKTEHTQKADTKSMTSGQLVDAMAAIKGLSEEDFARAFVRALLIEEFGEKLANSAQFQSVVDRTSDALQADTEVRAMLAAVRHSAS